jgi:uncharacterized protein YciI
MLYLIVAFDGTDDGAPARRAAARPSHLEAARPRNEEGRLPFGGAMLSEAGAMIGSAIVIEAADEAEARAYVENDPYTKGGVWVKYDVWPFKRAF